MTKRRLAIVALAALTIFLLLNRSTFTLQQAVVPITAVGFGVWLAYTKGWIHKAARATRNWTQATITWFREWMKPAPFEQQHYAGVGSAPPSGAGNNPSDQYDFAQNQPPSNHPKPSIQIPLYNIQVPSDSEWKPELARALILELAMLRAVAVRIAAEGSSIQWQVMDFNQSPIAATRMVHAIQKVYPEAIVTPGVYRPLVFQEPFYRSVEFFGQMTELFLPTAYAAQIKGSDPLALLANEMNDLEDGESVSYTIFFGQVEAQFYNDLQKMLTTSKWTVMDAFAILSPEGWGHLAAKAALGKDPDRYREQDMQRIYEKLNDFPLLLSHVVFEANSPSEERLKQFDIGPMLLQFGNDYQKLAALEAWKPFRVNSQHQADETSAIGQLWKVKDLRYAGVKIKGRSVQVGKGVTTKANNASQCIFCPAELAALWHVPHESFTSYNIEWVKGKQVPMPAVMRGSSEGMKLGENVISAGKTLPVQMLRRDRSTHMIVIGKPNMGKSTLLHNLVRQDIAEGYGVCVIDPSPQGKLVEDILRGSIADGREDDVFVWDLRNTQNPPPLNFMLSASKAEREDAATLIMSVFEKVYGADFGYSRMGHTLVMAMQAVMKEETPTIRDVTKLLRDDDYRVKMTAEVDSEAAYEFWEHWEKLSVGERETNAGHVIRRLQRLYDNRVLYPITCQPNPVDFGDLIRHRRIILVCLGVPADARLTPTDQSLLGSMMVSQIQMAMTAERFDHPFYVYIDEAQHFVTTALPEIFTEARKQNLSLTLANQYLGQLVGDTLRAVEGTIGAMVSFQIGEADAHKLDGMMKPEFSAYDLMNLEVHQAAVRMYYNEKQMRPFTLNTLSDPPKSENAEEREGDIRARSIQNFTTMSREDIIDWLTKRYPRKKAGKGREDENFSDPL